MMPKLLVALNDSMVSEKALKTAVALARLQGGQVTAIAVLERPRTPGFAGLTGDLEGKSRLRLEELLQSAVAFAQSQGVSLVPVLRAGHAADAILTYAEQEQVDMLVLGRNSRSGADHFMGGTANQVSNHCDCAVLLVK
jgi:nucleotide-binding universal stress UspA family protein